MRILIQLTVIMSLLLWLSGCSALGDRYGYHPGQILGGLTAETIGFTYRAIADGEVKKLTLKGPTIQTSEKQACFGALEGIELSYSFNIRSNKKFSEHIVWQRGEYRVPIERKIKYGKSIAPFPAKQVLKDLGSNWPGEWQVAIEVKGKPRGTIPFRLASRESAGQLIAQAEASEAEIRTRLHKRAKNCWPDCILQH